MSPAGGDLPQRGSDAGVGPTDADTRLKQGHGPTRGGCGAEAAERKPAGQDLGLNIVRRAVALHGWHIASRPREPHGLEVLAQLGASPTGTSEAAESTR